MFVFFAARWCFWSSSITRLLQHCYNILIERCNNFIIRQNHSIFQFQFPNAIFFNFNFHCFNNKTISIKIIIYSNYDYLGADAHVSDSGEMGSVYDNQDALIEKVARFQQDWFPPSSFEKLHQRKLIL